MSVWAPMTETMRARAGAIPARARSPPPPYRRVGPRSGPPDRRHSPFWTSCPKDIERAQIYASGPHPKYANWAYPHDAGRWLPRPRPAPFAIAPKTDPRPPEPGAPWRRGRPRSGAQDRRRFPPSPRRTRQQVAIDVDITNFQNSGVRRITGRTRLRFSRVFFSGKRAVRAAPAGIFLTGRGSLYPAHALKARLCNNG